MTLVTRILSALQAIGADIKALYTGKQDRLISGTHLKTLNGQTLLGAGNLEGVELALQPALFDKTTVLWLPSSRTALSIFWGVGFIARQSGTLATQAHPIKTSASALASLNRATFSTGNTAPGSCGIQTNATVAWRGNQPGLGGFLFFARFAIEAHDAAMRCMVGLSAHNAVLNAEPSSLVNSILLVKDSTDSQWFLSTRGTGAGTKTPTGLTVAAGTVLDFRLSCEPFGGHVVARISNAVTGAVLVDNLLLSANLPVNTVFMHMWAACQSTVGTTAKVLALNRMYLHTNL